MGRIYEGKCPLCGYEQEFFLEGGLMSINLEMCAEALPEAEQKQVKALIEQNEVSNFRIENYITECRSCRKMTGKTIIDITAPDWKKYVFGQHCKECGKKLKIYRGNVDATLKCPECRKGILDFEHTGLWD